MTDQELVDELQRLSALVPIQASEQLALTAGAAEQANLAALRMILDLGNEVRGLYRTLAKMADPNWIAGEADQDIDTDGAIVVFQAALQRGSLMTTVGYLRSKLVSGKRLTIVGKG